MTWLTGSLKDVTGSSLPTIAESPRRLEEYIPLRGTLLAYYYSGANLSEQNTGPEKVLYLKYWHVVLMLTIQLLGLGYGFGKVIQEQDDLIRRVSAIENTKFVSREEYDSFRQDLRDQMNRIETEILERNKIEGQLK